LARMAAMSSEAESRLQGSDQTKRAAWSSSLDHDRDATARRSLGDRHRDAEDAALELGAGAFGIDVLRQPDPARERAVRDLHLLVDAPVALRPLALPGDHEQLLAGDEADARRIDARQLHQHGQLGRIGGAEAVDVGPEAAALGEEARHLPEVG